MGDRDPVIDEVIARYEPRAVILYGSRARGDHGPTSDWDVLVVVPGVADGKDVRDTAWGWLDARIVGVAELADPEKRLHLREGRVLLDPEGIAADLLARTQAAWASPPKPISDDERAARIGWLIRTVERAAVDDVIGRYRRAWLLTDALEWSWTLQGRRYPGPKQAFAEMRAHDPAAYAIWDAALAPGAEIAAVRALVDRIAALNGSSPPINPTSNP